MAARRSPNFRLVTAALAVLCAGGLAAYPTVATRQAAAVSTPLAAVALAGLVYGLVRRLDVPLAISLVALGSEYVAASARSHTQLSLVTAAYAGALLLVAELAYWSVGEQVSSAPVQRKSRAATICATAAAGSAVAGLAVVAARASSLAGAWLVPTGAGAAAAAAWALSILSARSHHISLPTQPPEREH